MNDIVISIVNIVGLVVFYLFGKDAGYKEALKELVNGKMHITISSTKVIATIENNEESTPCLKRTSSGRQ